MNVIKATDQYTPDVCDLRPGNYYVSVVDGNRFQLLAGPFDTHKAALGMLGPVKDEAQKLDCKAVFYGFGTCRVSPQSIPRMGILNDRFGIH